MKWDVDMGSAVIINIPSFIKTVSGIRKLLERDTQTQTGRIEIA
jgi:hypothetical protein